MKLLLGSTRRTSRMAAGCALWALGLIASGSASAQVPPAAGTSSADDAATWFAKGSAAHEAGRFAEAEELFLKVWAVRKAWDVAANLGLAQVNLGKHVPAAENLSFALRWFPASEPVATRSVLERRLAASRAEVGAMKITVNVPGAEVSVGGAVKRISPIEEDVFVEPGIVTVEASKDGYESERRTVQVAKGGAEALSIVLQRTPPPERSKVPAYVAGAVGLVGTITGATLLGVAVSQRSDLANRLPRDVEGNLVCARSAPDTHPDCPALRAQATQLDTFGNAGVATMLVGGVVIAGAAAYYFWPSSSSRGAPSAGRLFPSVGPDGAGVVWTGSF